MSDLTDHKAPEFVISATPLSGIYGGPINDLKPSDRILTIVHEGKDILRLNADGTVWGDPDLKPDDAARKVLDIIADIFPQYLRKPA